MKLSEVLYSRRKELGLTQEQVSHKLNVTRQALSNWERGKNYPDIDILVKLTQIYNLSFDALIKGDTEVMKKINKDAQALRKQKKLKILDISLIVVIMTAVLIPFLLNLFGKQRFLNSRFMSILIFVLVMYIMIASLWHYRLGNPGPLNKRAPLLIPKSFGIGLTINPQNPIGLALWIILLIIVIATFIPIIF